MSLRVLNRPGAAGVLGKLPATGDFVRLNLGAAVAAALDGWLDAGLAALELADADWRDDFPLAPAWRFRLPPGTAGPQALAGVIRPSRDSAGRLFPLIAAAPLDAFAPEEAAASTGWCDRVEAALAGASDGATSADALIAELDALGSPAEAEPAPLLMRSRTVGEALFVDAEGGDDGRADALAAVLAAASPQEGSGLWWRHAGGRLRLIAAPRLPHGEAFAALFHASEASRPAPAPAPAPAPVAIESDAPHPGDDADAARVPALAG